MMMISFHHRKRLQSSSLTSDHKRSKSSREVEKDHSERRSRESKKDNTESRVRGKPLNIQRPSLSISRERSESKIKKDNRKDIKAQDEQKSLDPTDLDKVPGKDDEDEWVVTDVIEELVLEDNGYLEEEYDYEADEDDQYSHHSSTPHNNSCHSSPDRSNKQPDEDSIAKENGSQHDTLNNKENEVSSNKQESGSDDEFLPDSQENVDSSEENSSYKNENVRGEISSVEKEQIKCVVSKLDESHSHHRQRMKILSEKHEVEILERSYSYQRSRSDCQHSEELERLTKEQIKEGIKQDKELHQLRIKHELAQHKAELKVLEAQLDYWKNKQ